MLVSIDSSGTASDSHVVLFSGNRWLDSNKLTSVELGVFDKNTALLYLYVDQAKETLGERIRRGAVVGRLHV